MRLDELKLDAEDVLGKVMKEFDTDSDYQINLDEFKAGISRWLDTLKGLRPKTVGIRPDTMEYVADLQEQVCPGSLNQPFTAKGVPDLPKLSNAELISLLQYHTLNNYSPKGTFKTTKDQISTLATSGAGKFDLTTNTAGDDVYLHAGVDSARISGVVN
ncbi:hypothetical protein Droror1_Dr00020007 [Drosera rotundifolia]